MECQSANGGSLIRVEKCDNRTDEVQVVFI